MTDLDTLDLYISMVFDAKARLPASMSLSSYLFSYMAPGINGKFRNDIEDIYFSIAFKHDQLLELDEFEVFEVMFIF